MSEVFYLILRQMRRPAIVLIVTYVIAILGMHLIPTVDDNGDPVYLTLLESFYWITYTATTLGFGEVPYEFSQWQRAWTIFSIYMTVPSWLYAIGKIIALLQDPLFRYALSEASFTRQAKKLKKRFVIVCGFGEAGSRLVKLLIKNGYRCVVIDIDDERLLRMTLDPEFHNVLSISGDASEVALLKKAGIQSPFCRAVIAITNDDAINIKVSLSAKLLASDRENFQVITRTSSQSAAANAKSFNTDLIINTNQIFSERLTIAFRRPSIVSLMTRLHGEAGTIFEASPIPPNGRWMICGYGELGKNLKKFLDFEGVDSIIIDDQEEQRQNIDVFGSGAEAVILREARIDRAQAIVAARDLDADNLSIAITAKEMQPSLFVVGKQNRSTNEQLFDVAGFDLVMEEADLIVSKIFPYVARPVLARFIHLLHYQNETWGKHLLERFEKLTGDSNPDHMIVRIDDEHAPAVVEHIKSGHLMRMQSLWLKPHDLETIDDAIPLMLIRDGQEILLPQSVTHLKINDRILMVIRDAEVRRRLNRVCYDAIELFYALHGKDRIRSPVLRYLFKKWG